MPDLAVLQLLPAEQADHHAGANLDPCPPTNWFSSCVSNLHEA